MKKIVSLALLLTLVFSMTACGQIMQTETDADGNIETSTAAEGAQEGKKRQPRRVLQQIQRRKLL